MEDHWLQEIVPNSSNPTTSWFLQRKSVKYCKIETYLQLILCYFPLFFCSFNMNKDRISGLGNARTLHNENSSRFVSNILLGQDENSNFYLILQGKYIEICFDFKGDPTGGTITNCKFYPNLCYRIIY